MSAGQHAVSIPVIDMWAPIVPSDEIIEDLQSGFPTEQLQYLEVFTKTTVSDEQFAELRSFYSEGEIVELLCAIGLFNYFNRFNDALRMQPTKPGEGGCAASAAEAAAAR